MAGASLLAWLVVWSLTANEAWRGVLWGAAGPLGISIVSWLAVERTHRRNPAGVSALMIKMFGAKLVLVGALVAVAITRLAAGRREFVVSFTVQYILLHAIEAWYLRRLFSSGTAGLNGS